MVIYFTSNGAVRGIESNLKNVGDFNSLIAVMATRREKIIQDFSFGF